MILSLFHCDPKTLRAVPGLAIALRRAGVRHCEMQLLRSLTNDEGFEEYAHEWWLDQGEQIGWCRANGWRIVGRLDDGFRTVPERAALMRSREKFEYIALQVANCGICDKVEVCDEMNSDPRVYPVEFLADVWHLAGGPPLGFPSYSTHKYSRIPGLAGLHSCQWNWETAYTYKDRWKRLVASLSGLPQDDRPICVQIPVVKQYRKGADGGDGTFRPGIDRWLNRGMTGPGITNMVRDAIDLVGAERIQFRFYASDALWAESRATAKKGERVQVGMGPGDERWEGFLELVGLVMKAVGCADG